MGVVVDVSHSLRRQVRVHLGRGQGLVAQKLLDTAQVGAVVQQVGGEAVPQGVRADVGIEPGLGEVLGRRCSPTSASAFSG